MTTVRIPDPALVVLVGAAGAGKSTLAARLFAADEILSSDQLRAAIAGDPRDQRATGPAFAALHRVVSRRLADGLLTVVDATSVEPKARRPLVCRARDAGVPSVAIVLELPARVVLDRNARRAARVVDPGVVRHHLAVLRRSVDRGSFATEGWDLVVHLREPGHVDELRVTRVPLAPDSRPRRQPSARAHPQRRYPQLQPGADAHVATALTRRRQR